MARTVLWQQAGTYAAQADRGLFAALWPAGGVSGAVASAVNNTMNISIPPGSAAVPLQPGQAVALCRWDANEVVTITAAPPSGQSRIDVVVAQVRDNAIDGGANNDFIFSVVAGTPAATNPAVPATPTNALAFYNVTVPGAAANLNAAPIADRRSLGQHCEVYQTVSQGLPNTSYVPIDYDGVLNGYGYNRSATPNGGYVCPIAGRYLVTTTMTLDRTVTLFGVGIRLNGTAAKRGPLVCGTGVFNPAASLSATMKSAAGDVLTIEGVTGPAANTIGSAMQAWATFDYVGPL